MRERKMREIKKRKQMKQEVHSSHFAFRFGHVVDGFAICGYYCFSWLKMDKKNSYHECFMDACEQPLQPTFYMYAMHT